MCISDLMVDPRALELSFLRIPKTHETPSNSSTVTSGKAVYSKFAKTALLAAAAAAWASAAVEDTAVECVVALAAVEASVLVAAVEASASADVGVSAVAPLEAVLEAVPELVLPVVVLKLLPRQQLPRMPSPIMRLQGRNEMRSSTFEM
jgi:hypothetical protein